MFTLKKTHATIISQTLCAHYFQHEEQSAPIDEAIENRLYNYLGGICNRLECFPLKIGGHKEHVHILSHFCKKITVIKFLEELKSHSSNWIKTQHARYGDFYWQGGLWRVFRKSAIRWDCKTIH